MAPFVFDLNSVGCTVLSGSFFERFGCFQGLAASVFSLSCTISEVESMTAFFFRPAPNGWLSGERDRGCEKRTGYVISGYAEVGACSSVLGARIPFLQMPKR
jgi:hypothetical protein